MHALLAKPIDWCVIQLARRAMKLDRGAVARPAALALPVEEDFVHHPVSAPADLDLQGDGTFRFASSVSTGAPVNDMVHGRLFVPGANWRNRPSVVLLHGWNAETCYRRMFPDVARRLDAAGINAVAFELPYHMQRRPRNGPVGDFISGDLRAMLGATRQAIADTRAIARWLEAEGSRSVGVWGFSLGGWLAGLLSAIEPRLGCAVLTTPIASVERAIAELAFCEPIRRSLEGARVELARLNLPAQMPCLDRRRMLIVESRHDLFAPAESLEQLWRAWGKPEIWRLPHGHISVLFSRSMIQQTVEWVATKLRSPLA